MKQFVLKSKYKPTADQQNAIDYLSFGIQNKVKYQVLLGVTGSGKTFTVANTIQKLQKPALIISHNKTLAAQLYQEFRDFFPDNAVSYFVSYYDYYQPEAYIPSTDTYIEKDADINELIDKLRLETTMNISTRHDTIVVASVSCIYNIGSPKEYASFVLEISSGMRVTREQIIDRLVQLQYSRGDFGFHRGTFRVRGDTIDVYPAYSDDGIRIVILDGKIKEIVNINTVSGEKIATQDSNFFIYPAKHFITDPTKNENILSQIEKDRDKRVEEFESMGKFLEATRIKQKVTYDLEMIREIGYVKGIENYSRYFDGRAPGEAPYSLLEFFNHFYGDDWLVFVDESHITFPQIRGMYAGDLSRKKTLVDYGFRLPSALDNRPLKFDEFMRRIPNFIAVSATPDEWEIGMAKEATKNIASKLKDINYPPNGLVEQLLRPTGIPDPEVIIKPTENQVADVIDEVKKRVSKGQRTLITTLTKKTAEDLTTFLKEKGLKVQYLHSDVHTLDRTDILDDLRLGKYDVLVGINLLREGLDLPEVSLVAILDADKEGFLRSYTTLIQTMGRAARHVEGQVIMYADKITKSMEKALSEVRRRRKYQLEMNERYGIVPQNIAKPIREKLITQAEDSKYFTIFESKKPVFDSLSFVDISSMTPMDKKKL
ncbi:MAG: excinuclease ABC subunit UvrB, partial [Patescibacteria group bacterium]|nr:excinuclease ABC subunit UvrB [Patescibacteria group bacterium]